MPFPDLPAPIARALAGRGYAEPTPVQAAVLEAATAGADLLVSAQTGSGKTVAYGLAMAPPVLAAAGDETSPPRPPPRTPWRPGMPRRPPPVALVVAPTRELALQVARELGWLFEPAGARVVTCVGGMDMRRELRALGFGAEIVVGTPGRLTDHVRQGSLDVSGLRAVVLDEADEMLDLGFRDDLEAILDAAPVERRTLLFSATLPKPILALAKKYQRDAVRIAITAEDEPHGDIEHVAMTIAPWDREHAVVNVLRWFEVRGALVFCATREGVRRLHGNLQERGFPVVALSGELSQAERGRALQALRDGRARACVATDVAARGLDLPDLGLVVHADPPRDRAMLLHRSGRTGRAGRKGTSVLLVPAPWRGGIERLLRAAHVQATWQPAPSAAAIRERDQERLVTEIGQLAEDPLPEDLAAARALLATHAPEHLAAVLVRVHRRLLPAPEDLATPRAPRPEAGRPRRPGPGRGRPRPGAGGQVPGRPRPKKWGKAKPRGAAPGGPRGSKPWREKS